MLFKEYCILPFYQNRANQGIVINKKSSYCKDRANQGRLNQGLTVCAMLLGENKFNICSEGIQN